MSGMQMIAIAEWGHIAYHHIVHALSGIFNDEIKELSPLNLLFRSGCCKSEVTLQDQIFRS